MKRFWIVMNIIYEKLMLFVFVVALLVVAYGLYDAWYVYHKAGDDSYLAYKPVVGEVILTIRSCRAIRTRIILT